MSARRAHDGRRGRAPERGAAAVELAIILPLVLLLIGGIVDLGRLWFTKEVLTNAAREGARAAALGQSESEASARVTQALAGGVRANASFAYCGDNSSPCATRLAGCPSDGSTAASVTVTVSTPASGNGSFSYIILGPASRFFGAALVPERPTGTASMRCGG